MLCILALFMCLSCFPGCKIRSRAPGIFIKGAGLPSRFLPRAHRVLYIAETQMASHGRGDAKALAEVLMPSEQTLSDQRCEPFFIVNAEFTAADREFVCSF